MASAVARHCACLVALVLALCCTLARAQTITEFAIGGAGNSPKIGRAHV